MTAELISVGTEILMGNILNSNARYLAEKCASVTCLYLALGDQRELLDIPS